MRDLQKKITEKSTCIKYIMIGRANGINTLKEE